MWIALAPLLLPPAPVQDGLIPPPLPLEHFDARRLCEELVEAGDFASAVPLLRELTRAMPYDGEVWLLLARCEQRLASYGEAIESYERALALGFGNAPLIHYEIASCHALRFSTDEAFAALDRALASRLENRSSLLEDPDLASLHDDPRWRETAGLAPGEGLTPEEGWRMDLLHLKKEMDRLHMNIGHAAPREEIDKAVADLYERIPGIPEHRIPIQMQRIVRLLNDGHSVVYPLSRRAQPTQLPLTFYWFPEGLFVTNALPQHEEWIGSRVIRIGTGRAEQFAEDLRPIVTRDNRMGILWMGPFYLLFPAILHDLGYIETIESVPILLEKPDGQSLEVLFEPVPMHERHQRLGPPKTASRLPLYLRDVDDHYGLEPLDEHTLYVWFHQVVDEPEESLNAFAERLRELVVDKEVNHLIVDVRHNRGGVSFLATELVRTLVYFDTSREASLYVLIGRNTYSAAQIFITDVERWTDAIFVGEPSGSRPNMVSEESEVILPYSGTLASISCRYFQQSWPGDDRSWIAPDIPVMLTAEDYFGGRDPALEVVLEHIRR